MWMLEYISIPSQSQSESCPIELINFTEAPFGISILTMTSKLSYFIVFRIRVKYSHEDSETIFPNNLFKTDFEAMFLSGSLVVDPVFALTKIIFYRDSIFNYARLHSTRPQEPQRFNCCYRGLNFDFSSLSSKLILVSVDPSTLPRLGMTGALWGTVGQAGTCFLSLSCTAGRRPDCAKK